MAELKNLQDLLHHEIQVLYSAETQLIAAMPRMAEKAHNQQLKSAIEMHLAQTKQQKERLEQAAKLLGIDPDGDDCPSMKGLIAESEKTMHKDATPEVLDAALICGAQKIEHYEIAGYGTAAHLAEGLGLGEVHSLLSKTLDEEKNTDAKLNSLAKGTINPQAV